MRLTHTLLALPLAALVAAGAGTAARAADEEPFVPVLRTERVWFACGPDKVDNVRQAQASGPITTWDLTAPTQSVQQGAGCGSADAPFTQTTDDNTYDTYFRGTFTGNLDSVTAELHSIDVSQSRSSGPMTIQVRLAIDGVELLPGEIGAGVPVEVTPVASASKLTDRFRFTVTDVGFITKLDQGEHEITLALNGGKVVQRGPTVTDAVNAWVWDTTEVPAGLTFNPSSPEAAKVKGVRPVEESVEE